MSQVFDRTSRADEPIGLRLKIARIRAGVKQYELAQRIGVSSALLSRIETGLLDPKPELVAKLSAELGIDLMAVAA